MAMKKKKKTINKNTMSDRIAHKSSHDFARAHQLIHICIVSRVGCISISLSV